MAERALTRKKGLGAYYTNPAVGDFLVTWGIDAAPGVVMDPACGDGRFLRAAAGRGATLMAGIAQRLTRAAVSRGRPGPGPIAP